MLRIDRRPEHTGIYDWPSDEQSVSLGGGTCDNRITEPCPTRETNQPSKFTRQ
jgi:hypothetical protein